MQQVSARQLAERLADESQEKPLLLDVREPWEYELCHVAGSKHLPMAAIPARLAELEPEKEVVVICHHGRRSMQVAMFLESAGFSSVHNLMGGVEAWARDVARPWPAIEAEMKKISLLLALAFASGSLWAADLVQVYREAQANDPAFAAARSTLEAGREKESQGLSGLLPTVGISGNTTWNENEIAFRSGAFPTARPKFNSNGYNLSLSQPLFRWQNWVAYGQSKLQVAQAEASFVQAQQDLVLRVAQAYFDYLYASENLAAVRANKTAIEQQLESAKKNFEVGTATITDTHEAQSRFDLAVAQELAAENDLEVKRRALQAIIGKVPEGLAPLKGSVTLSPPQPAGMDKWVEAAEKDSTSVQIQLAAADIAAREVERQRAGHYPTLDLVASKGRTNTFGSTAFGLTETDFQNVGLQVNLPLFQGGQVTSRTREAAANRGAALSNLEAARRTSALAARQYYLGVVSGLAQIKALDAALASSQLALESNRLGYEVGVRINIDVLNAEQQVYVTRRDLAKAKYDTLLAQLRLKAAVGALGENDVQQVNALLDPLATVK